MTKFAISLIVSLAASMGAAHAASQNWNVTEEAASGIKAGQGTWSVNTDADNKITGSATLQSNSGTPITYKLSGTVKDSVYTVELIDRTDGKKGCVWTGAVPSSGTKAGLIGKAVCQSGGEIVIRAGF
jgi:hypothetical protein